MIKESILLVGGAGFIGSHIAERYVRLGADVIILDDLSSGTKSNLAKIINAPNFYFYEGSVLDTEILQQIFSKHHITIINNHAAQKSVPASVGNPLLDNKINVIGLLNLLACTKTHPIKRFIQASTGGALAKEITGAEASKETDWPLFSSPYSITKFATEQYLEIYSKLYNFEYIALRYANVYGPRQIADGECGVVPIFVDNIMANMPSKLMTYSDMPRGCTRDYIYVEDVAELNEIITKSEQIISGVYNVGSGKEIAMLDIYEKITKIFDKDVPIETVGPRAGDLRRSFLDSSKLEKTFNWHPRTSFEDGLQKLYTYYQTR